EAARSAYQSALSIRERLAKSEPDRADYQRDLSVSYERMGDLYSALGQGEAARSAYQSALSIRERLAESEPDRADYQRDLAASYERMATVEPSKAGAWLEPALAIRCAAVEREPENVVVRRELAIVLIQCGHATQSELALRSGAAILIELRRAGVLEARYVPLSEELEAQFGSAHPGAHPDAHPEAQPGTHAATRSGPAAGGARGGGAV
ncbi:MAG TPA: hypothetical protein PKC43_05005, partial [Phycisphaerales bacterium]|nr:hypothetical protein [Phycisphaerales bacterium]HMP36788.1 hypothetical protein [Phycisphaerales bacterium]